MSKYYYIKTKNNEIFSVKYIFENLKEYYDQFKSEKKYFTKFLGIIFILAGLLIFLYFFFPMISYNLFLSQYLEAEIETPIPKYLVVKSSLKSLFTSGFISLTSDFTDARSWYPHVKSGKRVDIESYTLSIPKLKIENALVSTTDYDLSKHLVHYFGTSAPGEKGTAVIFGHSTLPQLFDPKNYKSIFARLHFLKVNDEVFVNIGKLIYKYKIFSVNITDPQDTNMFSQVFDSSYITLVTCTPPGTVWKRLVVKAGLESI